MKKENKEALKSSVLVAVANSAFWYSIASLAGSPAAHIAGMGGAVVGLLLGLLTTWYPEE